MKLAFGRILLCSVALLSFENLFAQQNETRSVFASGGGHAQLGSNLIHFTIGDLVVGATFGKDLLLTEGFQQPEMISSSWTPRVVANMQVFPNPASGSTKVEFDLLADALVQVNLVNNAGQMVHSGRIKSLAGRLEYVVPLNGLAAGVYHVVLYVNRKTYSEILVVK